MTTEAGTYSLYKKNNFFKYLTMLLFFVLPKKIANVFVSLSIMSLVFRLRDSDIVEDPSLKLRIEYILNIHVSQDVLLLPGQTIDWYWNDKLLNEKVEIEGKQIPFKDLITDKVLFMRHRAFVINRLLDHLPKILKMKLGLRNKKNRLSIKHNIVGSLMYA